MLLPGPLGRVGEFFERHAVPIVYRNRALVTAAPFVVAIAFASSSAAVEVRRASPAIFPPDNPELVSAKMSAAYLTKGAFRDKAMASIVYGCGLLAGSAL